MDRDWALTQLGKGKKVRYSLWDKKDYICVNNGHLITNTGKNAAIVCIINNDTDDWELFEEQDFVLGGSLITGRDTVVKEWYYPEENVKKFINLVKDIINAEEYYDGGKCVCEIPVVFEKIDKLAGERLVELNRKYIKG